MPAPKQAKATFNLERAERANLIFTLANTGDMRFIYLRALFPTKSSWSHFLRTRSEDLTRQDILRRRIGRGDILLDTELLREYVEATAVTQAA